MSDRGQQTSPSEPGTPAPDVPVEKATGHSPGDDFPAEGPAEGGPPSGAGSPQFGGEPVFEIEPERLEPVVAPEQPRSKVRTVLLSGLLAVALGGAATLAYVGWQINTQRHTTLSTPSTIGGLTLDDSEDAATTADYLQSALAAEITMDKSVGAVYTGDDNKSVLFFGGSTLLWAPGKELDNSFTLLGDEEGGVTGLSEVDAGELGGTMKCGVTTSEGTEMTVCGWADHGSLALAMFLDRTEAEAAPLMREIRKATQTRD